MQNHWTKYDIAATWKRFERTYAHDPVAYRFLCGLVFKMKPMKMRWITISLVSGLSVIENIVTGQPRNPMIWHGYWNLCRRIT